MRIRNAGSILQTAVLTLLSVFEFMVHSSLLDQTYNAPFHIWHANGRRLQSQRGHGRFDDFETKEKKKKKDQIAR